MLNNHLAEEVLGRALSTGGDFAEIFMEDTTSQGIVVLGSNVENASTSRMCGVGIRVYKGLNSVYAYTNDLSRGGLLRCASDAAAAVGEGGAAVDVRLNRSVAANIHPYALLPVDVDGKRKVEALLAMDQAARSVSPEIVQVSASYSGKWQQVQILNSEGLNVSDQRVYVRVRVQAVAANGSENQTGTESPGALKGHEFVDSLDLEQLGKSAGQCAVTMLHADNCPAGQMPVVIDGGFGGVIFHEACGHALEATSVAKGNSVFCGKLGQPIAAKCVSAMDDGTMANEWGSLNIDDEGIPTQRKLLIENGVLKSYMIDRLNARRMGMPSTGSGRRQDYSFAPTSRMTNTFICEGTDDEEEMLRTMGDGLYAKTMGGGSVNPVTGEFNFAVNEAYLVKDGKIDRPVRGATLIGKGSQILWDIDRVGRHMTMAQGMCGSLSGSVPTNVGQPRIRVSRITVGGR